MPSLPSFPCYHQRWLADTAHLSLAAQGLYWRFLCWSWANGPLPLDPVVQRRLAGLGHRSYTCLWREVEPFWLRTSKGFYNTRLEVLKHEAMVRSSSQQDKAIKRWEKQPVTHAAAYPAADAGGMPSYLLSPLQDQDQDQNKPPKPKPLRRNIRLDDKTPIRNPQGGSWTRLGGS